MVGVQIKLEIIIANFIHMLDKIHINTKKKKNKKSLLSVFVILFYSVTDTISTRLNPLHSFHISNKYKYYKQLQTFHPCHTLLI